MDTYVTGATIKRLREAKNITQSRLADEIGVTDKAVSKWETAKGLPDISLIEPLCRALGDSITELMSGNTVINGNVACNMLKSRLYVCPVCQNVIHATGNAVISCCGINLPPLVAEQVDAEHEITVERVEDEYFVSVKHEMTKQHYISFMAHVSSDRVQLVKLYPEGDGGARFKICGGGNLYIYCNRHGLMMKKL